MDIDSVNFYGIASKMNSSLISRGRQSRQAQRDERMDRSVTNSPGKDKPETESKQVQEGSRKYWLNLMKMFPLSEQVFRSLEMIVHAFS